MWSKRPKFLKWRLGVRLQIACGKSICCNNINYSSHRRATTGYFLLAICNTNVRESLIIIVIDEIYSNRLVCFHTHLKLLEMNPGIMRTQTTIWKTNRIVYGKSISATESQRILKEKTMILTEQSFSIFTYGSMVMVERSLVCKVCVPKEMDAKRILSNTCMLMLHW